MKNLLGSKKHSYHAFNVRLNTVFLLQKPSTHKKINIKYFMIILYYSYNKRKITFVKILKRDLYINNAEHYYSLQTCKFQVGQTAYEMQ